MLPRFAKVVFGATCNVSTSITIDPTYVTTNSCTLISLTGTPTITWSGTINADVTIASGTTTFNGSLVLGSSNVFTVSSGAFVTHASEDKNGIQITAYDVVVTGTLDANNKGCLGGAHGAVGTQGRGPNTSTGDCTAATSGGGAGGSVGFANNYAGGAAYGGYGGGGTAQSTAGGAVYGTPAAPNLLGSGGGSGINATGNAAAGGGRIYVNATHNLTVNGTIRANGEAASGSDGGGSGGGIDINVAGAISGSGSITANGGSGVTGYCCGFGAGAGGGGLIAVKYASGTPPTVTANGGSTGAAGSKGSTYVVNTTTNAASFPSGALLAGDISYGSMTFSNSTSVVCLTSLSTINITVSGTLAFGGTNLSCGSLTSLNITAATVTTANTNTFSMTSNGAQMTWTLTNDVTFNTTTVTLGGHAGTTSANGATFTINGAVGVALVSSTFNANLSVTNATVVSIDGSSTVSANNKGCNGGDATTSGAQDGHGYGPSLVTGICAKGVSGYGGDGYNGAGSAGGGGASHGGQGGGGSGVDAGTGTTYDSVTAPTLFGSGGGAGNGGVATTSLGGGKIYINASTSLTVNGILRATGGAGTSSAGGGSGGSIYLITTSISGSGSVTANGGNGGIGSCCGYGGGGGGGGRVSVRYISGTPPTLTANGGTGASVGTTSTTQLTAPSTPTISSPTAGVYNVSANPTIAAAYSSDGASQTSADYKITTDSGGSTIVWSKTGDAVNLTSIVVNTTNGTFAGALSGQTQLAANTLYYAFVRHINGAGTSSWSTAVSFTTVATTNTSTFNSNFSNGSNYSIGASSEVTGGVVRLTDLGGGTYPVPTPSAYSSWTRRKAITVTEASGVTLTNFQVRITVAYDSDMQADFDDLRFANASGTALDYWLESKTDSTTATVWVEIDSLTASSPNTIYMYYGNGAVSTASSSASTFIREIGSAAAVLALDEGSGTSLADTSSNSHTGTLTSGPTWQTSGNCKRGQCVSLDGSDDYIALGTWFNLQTFSISFWVRPDSTQNNAYADILDNNHTGARSFVFQQNNTTTNQYSFWNSGTFNLTGNTWQHVVAVKNASGTTVYVNGVSVATGPAASITYDGTQDLKFGKWGGGGRVWKGYLDEIAIYSTDLTSGEAADLYNNRGYTTTSYAGKTLVRKYASTDPGVSVGSELVAVPESAISTTNGPTLSATYVALGTFTETLGAGNLGSVSYQLSNDGTNWKYWNGTNWVAASTGNYNSATVVNNFLPQFTTDVGRGEIYVKSFLLGTNQYTALDNLAITYEPLTVSLSAATQTVAESVVSVTVTAQLSSTSGSDVVIPYTVSGTATGGGTDHNLANGNITVTAGQTTGSTSFSVIDDSIDENDETVIVTLGTPNIGELSGTTVQTITITDNDTAGVTVGTISSHTTEAGGTAVFTVVLDSEPTAGVTIGLSSSNTAEGTVLPSSLVFSTVNWATPQTVTVTGANDYVDDGDVSYTIITAAATSADGNYSGVNAADVTATNNDNDTAGFMVGSISDNTTEAGGTATFSILLTSQPTANVVIGLTSSDLTEGTVAPFSFTFTAGDWNVPQTATVTGVDDFVDDGDISYSIVTAAATSVDGLYNGMNPANVALANIDNDGAGITVGAISGDTTEAGATATFSVVLASEPTADVTIGLSSNDTSEGTVSPSSLTFTVLNWNAPRTVTVTGVNDDVDDGDIGFLIITAAATSADSVYSGMNSADEPVTNIDNDTAGMTLTESDGATAVKEGDITDTYTIVLGTQPTATVTVTISATAQVSTSPTTLTFNAGNWSVPQTVTVTAVNDFTVEATTTGTLSHTVSSADLLYNGMALPEVVAAVTDNDHSSSTSSSSTAGSASPTITLLSPLTGASFAAGSDQTITWSYTGTIPFVVVQFSNDNAQSWSELKLVQNFESTTVTLPNVAVQDGLLRLQGTDLAVVSAVSNSATITLTATSTYEFPTTEPAAPAGSNSASTLPGGIAADSLCKLADDGNPLTTVDSAVYFIGSDNRRHPFPNSNVYFTWYTDFSGVNIVNESQLTQIPLGSNVTYRPGVKMVKFDSSPKVYVVDRYGVLRWVENETVAAALYGSAWNTMIVDISDAFFSNYQFGSTVTSAADFSPSDAASSAPTPDSNLEFSIQSVQSRSRQNFWEQM